MIIIRSDKNITADNVLIFVGDPVIISAVGRLATE